MARLELVIADEDKDYANRLCAYIRTSFKQTFIVEVLNEKSRLQDYLHDGKRGKAIYLISPGFQCYMRGRENDIGAVIILSPYRDNLPGTWRYPSLYKYQRVDLIIKGIMKLLCGFETVKYESLERPNKPKVVAVYSAAGGTGKTTIATALSIQASWEGNKVLYLNLEDISSSPFFLGCEDEYTLSGILYFLRAEDTKAALRIEGAVCCDPLYQVCFFNTLGSIIEFREEWSKEISILLEELKKGSYDYILIDLSNGISETNLAVLYSCDHILLVGVPSSMCLGKERLLMESFLQLERREGVLLTDKVIRIKNIRGGDYAINDELHCNTIECIEPAVEIPFVRELLSTQDTRSLLDMNSSWGAAIHELLRIIS